MMRLASVAFIVCVSSFARAADEHGIIAPNEGVLIDGKTFQLSLGKPKSDPSSLLKEFGAKELGPAALIFRIDDKLYIVDAPLITYRGGSDSADDKTIYGVEQAQTNRILVDYVPPKNPEHQYLYEMLKERRAFETLQEIYSPFRLPVALNLKAVGCGMVNAWYAREESRPTVTVCYEYLDHILQGKPTMPTESGLSPADVVLGQFFYLVTHEVGHAMFDILDVPVFGRQEDAADQFAAYIMLAFGPDRARRLIGGAAYSYKKYFVNAKDKPNVTLPLTAFSSTHGQPEERFYNLLCAAYGANPTEFAFLVEKEYLPKTRARSCGYEFSVLARAFNLAIAPSIDRELAKKVLDMAWMTGGSAVH
jgi:Putative metallopeptidase